MIPHIITHINFLPKLRIIADKKGIPLRHYIAYYFKIKIKIKTNN